ncbi:hypothetical protein TNCV_936921 [Trichonephila clavipes]|nr:hypothetical protein TNCV_936921 [Trichonephila clavipes]
MPTPVQWPAVQDYPGVDPWREQPDRYGPTDFRLGSSQMSLLAREERDEVLGHYVRLFTGAVGQDFILMDVNARLNRAHLVDEFLKSGGDIRRVD